MRQNQFNKALLLFVAIASVAGTVAFTATNYGTTELAKYPLKLAFYGLLLLSILFGAKSKVQRWRRTYDQAVATFEQGDYPTCRTLCQTLNNLDPDKPHGFLLEGNIHSTQARRAAAAEAESLFREAHHRHSG